MWTSRSWWLYAWYSLLLEKLCMFCIVLSHIMIMNGYEYSSDSVRDLFRLCRLRFVGDFLDAIESSATSAMFRQEETALSWPPAGCIGCTLAISSGNYLGGGETGIQLWESDVAQGRPFLDIFFLWKIEHLLRLQPLYFIWI